MKLSGSEVLFPEYATPSEASANSPRGSVLICANPVFVLIPPRRPRPVSAAQQPAFVDAPGAQFRKDCWHPQKPSFGRWLRKRQRFFRNWAPGESKEAGAWGEDAIRNITGEASGANSVGPCADGMGAIYRGAVQGNATYRNGSYGGYLMFDASRVVPTGPENVPPHVWQPVCLYLGRPTQV